ncbi:Cytochrome P450 [Rhypophila decipiens]
MAFSTGGLLLAGSGLLVLAFLIKGTYYAFFHPLAKVPGPKLWAFTDLFWLYYVCRGVWPYKNKELHEKYGPVVRFTPDDVSFIGAGAWKIIHNNSRTDSTNNYHKDMRVYRPSVSGHVHIINANDEHHRRHRRLLGFAFSEKALRGQEDLIQASQYGQADLHQWINFVTFDLTCELSFVESLGNLERGEFHSWVSVFFDSLKLMAYGQVAQRHPAFGALVMWLITRKFKNARLEHWQLADTMVRKRLASGSTRKEDFMTHLLARNQNDEKGQLTDEELVENAYVFVGAGSETSGTALCGTLYFLLMNRDKLDLLMEEICSTFKSEKEITGERLAKLDYLNAVFEESMRIYPGIPMTLPRIAPERGQLIEGYWIPGGTGVGIPPVAASTSEENFRDPLKFVPERWMGDPAYANDKFEASQPFSAGPRNCIGKKLAYLEMRLILVRLLWNFDFELMAESIRWLENHKVFILNDKPPLFVKFKRSMRASK